MTDARAYFLSEVERVQRGGNPGSEPVGDEEQRYAAGAPGAEDQDDDQDEEQEPAGQSVDLPDEWPSDFWSALTPEAQAEYEAGDHDLVEEYRLWVAGQVGTGEVGADDGLPAEPPVELPPTADEMAGYSQRWSEIAAAGGDGTTSAAAALAHADEWAYASRAAALAEYRAGRRRDLDLHPDDLNRAVQAEVDRRTEEGRRKWENR